MVETIDGSVILVGCDGFRLHRSTVPFEGDAQDSQLLYHKQDAIVGIRQYKKGGLRKKDIVGLTMGERGVLIAANCRTRIEWDTENWGNPVTRSEWSRTKRRYVTVKISDEPTRPNYPDWTQIWPQDGTTIEADKSKLITILKAIIAKAKEESKSRYWNAYCTVTTENGAMTFNRLSSEGNVGEEVGSIPVEGTAITFGINAKYLLEALYGIEGNRVSIRVQDDPGHPLVVGDVAVVMPVHIGRGR